MYREAASELTNLRQVAAATTGVGILSEHNGKKVFIKIQRPGLIESTSRDSERILQLVSGKVEAENIVKSFSKGVFEELDLRMEAFNYEVAKIIYQDPSKGMCIPDIIKDFEPSAKVMEINSDQERKFYDLLQELMREADAKNVPTDMVMNRSVSAALQAGIEPPESIINWGRGKGMLQFKIEDDLNKEFLTNRKHLLTANFKGFKTDKVMLEVVAKNVKKNNPGQVVSRTARQEAVLTVNALLRFIKDKGVFLLKKYCNLDLTRRR